MCKPEKRKEKRGKKKMKYVTLRDITIPAGTVLYSVLPEHVPMGTGNYYMEVGLGVYTIPEGQIIDRSLFTELKE